MNIIKSLINCSVWLKFALDRWSNFGIKKVFCFWNKPTIATLQRSIKIFSSLVHIYDTWNSKGNKKLQRDRYLIFNPNEQAFTPNSVPENPLLIKNSAKSGKEISIPEISSEKQGGHTPPMSNTPVFSSESSCDSLSFDDNDKNDASVHDSSF